MLTQQQLKEHLFYDPNTGIFIREKTSGRHKKGNLLGTVNIKGYVVIRIQDKLHLAHRLAWLYVYGKFPSDVLDHINRNKTDNRIDNLREIYAGQNSENTLISKANRSGLKGVGWYAPSKKWRSKITVNRKTVHLGHFDNKEDAHLAYCYAAKKYHSINPYAIDHSVKECLE
jgi:hypothetical protein